MRLLTILVAVVVLASSLSLRLSPSATRGVRVPRERMGQALFGVSVDKPAGGSDVVERSNFLNHKLASSIRSQHGTPVFVYDEKTLREQATTALAFPNSYGLTVRFAMKACPNAAILQLFHSMGLNFDASSGFEVERAIKAGIPASAMSLSSQEFPENFKDLIEKGIEFNACSLNQLETFGKLFPGGKCGLRFNPGKGSGGTGKTNVGGPSSSFGIWFELLDDVKAIVKKYNLNIIRIHTHIGSGSDPAIWQEVSAKSLALVGEFPTVSTLNLGGGFKVGRMSYEKAAATDMQKVGIPIKAKFEEFAKNDGRKLKLEIEPGTFLVANSGALLTTVRDIVTTGKEGHQFIKLDAGMTEVLRPSLYGAQHPIVVLKENESTQDTGSYIVVGHCCESGDLFSCAPGDPEGLQERKLSKTQIGDLVTLEGSGAYCAGMSTKNYNSFPEAPEVIVDLKGEPHLIRRRQPLDQIFQNEVPYKISK
jgi:diaminopimelate decarboxylase